MSNQSAVEALTREIDKTSPSLHQALYLLIQDVYRLDRQLNPPTSKFTIKQGGISPDLDDITNFTCTAFPVTFQLKWDILPDAFLYELRMGGTGWEDSVKILTTNTNVINLDPTEYNFVYGTYDFWLKPIDINGLYGANAVTCSLTVAQIGAPDISVSAISNTALLSWSVPSSTWKIDYYIIKRNGVQIATVSGTFLTQVEVVGGTFTYSVVAVDIVGNQSTESAGASAEITDPLSYVLLSSLNADYLGTYVGTENIVYQGFNGIAGALTIETWQQHFVNNSWTTINDQITAGYPLYYQPSGTTGTYKEVFDFGSIQENVRLVVNHGKIQLAGSTDIDIDIEVSDDDISYSSPVSGPSALFASVRYARVTWTFTNATDLSLAFIYNLTCSMDVQLELDSGTITANAGDSGGTAVTFNVVFRFVNSITITTESPQPVSVIYKDVTVTGFKVLVFDSTGNRITLPISWKARGAI